jgi:hypothetical protein
LSLGVPGRSDHAANIVSLFSGTFDQFRDQRGNVVGPFRNRAKEQASGLRSDRCSLTGASTLVFDEYLGRRFNGPRFDCDGIAAENDLVQQ